MKKWLAILLCALLVLSGVACRKKAAQEEEAADYSFADGDQYDHIGGELNVLNWGEYIDPELIRIFEEETGVKVNYTEMTSNEEMLIKLRSADNPYDMCFPLGREASRQAQRHVRREIQEHHPEGNEIHRGGL